MTRYTRWTADCCLEWLIDILAAIRRAFSSCAESPYVSRVGLTER